MIILYFVLELLFCSQAYFIITHLAAHVQHVSLCNSYRVTHNI